MYSLNGHAGPGRAIQRGGGVKGLAINEKRTFFNLFFQCSNILTAIKLEGEEGGLALMAWPLSGLAIKSKFFLRLP